MSLFLSHVERLRPSGKKEILCNLLGPILVFLLLNFSAGWYLEHFATNLGYRLIREKWKLLHGLPGKVDWVILGDSSGNQGLRPDILKETLGVSSVNLCTIGSLTLAGDAWMLEAYLRKFGPPRKVLIIHSYDVWAREISRDAMAMIPEPWGFWESYHPSPEFTPRDTFKIFLARYVPLYSQHQTLTEIFASPRTAFRKHFTLREDGFMAEEEPDPKTVRHAVRNHLASVRKRPSFHLSSINVRALKGLEETASQHRFEIIFVNGPLYRGMYEQEDFRSYYNRIIKWLADFTASSPSLRSAFEEPFLFSENEMQSIDHVTVFAAERYTREVVIRLRALKDRKK